MYNHCCVVECVLVSRPCSRLVVVVCTNDAACMLTLLYASVLLNCMIN